MGAALPSQSLGQQPDLPRFSLGPLSSVLALNQGPKKTKQMPAPVTRIPAVMRYEDLKKQMVAKPSEVTINPVLDKLTFSCGRYMRIPSRRTEA